MLVVGFCGAMGAGKDYYADHLAGMLRSEGYKVRRVAIANYLRDSVDELIRLMVGGVSVSALAERYGVSVDDILYFGKILKAANKESGRLVSAYHRTAGVRMLLQFWDDLMRMVHGSWVWVRNLSLDDESIVIVSDLRSASDMDYLKYNGCALLFCLMADEGIRYRRVCERDGVAGISEDTFRHPSEYMYLGYNGYDLVVDTGAVGFSDSGVFEKVSDALKNF